jgi:hypothetical protein
MVSYHVEPGTETFVDVISEFYLTTVFPYPKPAEETETALGNFPL